MTSSSSCTGRAAVRVGAQDGRAGWCRPVPTGSGRRRAPSNEHASDRADRADRGVAPRMACLGSLAQRRGDRRGLPGRGALAAFRPACSGGRLRAGLRPAGERLGVASLIPSQARSLAGEAGAQAMTDVAAVGISASPSSASAKRSPGSSRRRSAPGSSWSRPGAWSPGRRDGHGRSVRCAAARCPLSQPAALGGGQAGDRPGPGRRAHGGLASCPGPRSHLGPRLRRGAAGGTIDRVTT
jgi:hypothetical protein